jgi:hypothetical protein
LNRSKLTSILIAPLLLLTGAGPTFAADTAPATPTVSVDEAQVVLVAAIGDRSGAVVESSAPAAPTFRLSKYKVAKEVEKDVVSAGKQRLKGFGFRYTSAATTVQMTEITGSSSAATVKFDESGTLFLASDTTGLSDVPEQYRVHETATFIKAGAEWILDEVIPDTGQSGLPLSMIDPREPSQTTKPQASGKSKGATPGKPGDKANAKKMTPQRARTLPTTQR